MRFGSSSNARLAAAPMAAIAALSLAGCAGGRMTQPGDVTAVTTPRNTEAELAHWAYWDNQCRAEPFTVAITTPPSHGAIEVRDAVMAVPTHTSSGAATGCVDALVESKKVFYLPKDGYAGPDRASVQFSGSTGVVAKTYAITVQ